MHSDYRLRAQTGSQPKIRHCCVDNGRKLKKPEIALDLSTIESVDWTVIRRMSDCGVVRCSLSIAKAHEALVERGDRGRAGEHHVPPETGDEQVQGTFDALLATCGEPV